MPSVVQVVAVQEEVSLPGLIPGTNPPQERGQASSRACWLASGCSVHEQQAVESKGFWRICNQSMQEKPLVSVKLASSTQFD